MALRACGFIVFRRLPPEGAVQFLLLQTSYGEHHWTPPKGHVDPGEDDLTTALRETHEEAGLRAEHLDVEAGFERVLSYEVRGRQKLSLYWLARLRDPRTEVVLSEEHQNFSWSEVEAACELVRFPDMQRVLREAFKYIQEKYSQ